MATGLGGPQRGQSFFVTEQRKWNKVNADVIEKGLVGAFDGSGNVVVATNQTNKFVVFAEGKGNGDPKISVFMPGSEILVEVDAGQTATIGSELVVSGSGKVKDRGAAAANLVCGVAEGTIDQQDGNTKGANVSAGGYVIMRIAEWRYV